MDVDGLTISQLQAMDEDRDLDAAQAEAEWEEWQLAANAGYIMEMTEVPALEDRRDTVSPPAVHTEVETNGTAAETPAAATGSFALPKPTIGAVQDLADTFPVPQTGKAIRAVIDEDDDYPNIPWMAEEVNLFVTHQVMLVTLLHSVIREKSHQPRLSTTKDTCRGQESLHQISGLERTWRGCDAVVHTHTSLDQWTDRRLFSPSKVYLSMIPSCSLTSELKFPMLKLNGLERELGVLGMVMIERIYVSSLSQSCLGTTLRTASRFGVCVTLSAATSGRTLEASSLQL